MLYSHNLLINFTALFFLNKPDSFYNTFLSFALQIKKYQSLTLEFQNKRRQLQHMTMDLKQKLVIIPLSFLCHLMPPLSCFSLSLSLSVSLSLSLSLYLSHLFYSLVCLCLFLSYLSCYLLPLSVFLKSHLAFLLIFLSFHVFCLHPFLYHFDQCIITNIYSTLFSYFFDYVILH